MEGGAATGAEACSGTAHAKGKAEREWEHAVSVAIRLTHSTQPERQSYNGVLQQDTTNQL